MKRFFLMSVVNSVGFYLVSLVMPSITLKDPSVALLAGVVLSVLNITVRPLIVVIGLPFNILTLGLLTLVINALMVMITDSLVKGLSIPGFWFAFLAAVIISVVTMISRQFANGSRAV